MSESCKTSEGCNTMYTTYQSERYVQCTHFDVDCIQIRFFWRRGGTNRGCNARSQMMRLFANIKTQKDVTLAGPGSEWLVIDGIVNSGVCSKREGCSCTLSKSSKKDALDITLSVIDISGILSCITVCQYCCKQHKQDNKQAFCDTLSYKQTGPIIGLSFASVVS